MGKFKERMKKIYMKINPTYRKLDFLRNEVSTSLDAMTNQCWSVRHQNLQLKQEVERLNNEVQKLNQLNERLDSLFNKTQSLLFLAIQNNKETISDAKKKFWANYPKATGDMKIVQDGNLFMMKEFKKLCNEIKVKFWLHGGTLIGALRHGGFIPWDDDVDVAMTREDFEKLKKAIEKNNKYKIEELYHDEESLISKAYQFKLQNEEIPNFVDIFIFDKCQVDGGVTGQTETLNKIRSIRRDLVAEYAASPRKIHAQDIGCYHFGPVVDEEKEFIDKMFDAAANKINNPYEGNAYYYSIQNYPFPYPVLMEEKMFPLKTIKFEDTSFDVPNEAEFYLDGYVDIWNIPTDIDKHPHLYYYEPFIDNIKKFVHKNKNS